MTVRTSETDLAVPIDPRYIEVCERDSIKVCGCVPDKPVMVGAAVEGGAVLLEIAQPIPPREVEVTLRLTGIRKGFAGLRFPDRTKEEFEANEAFIKSAQPKGS